MTTSKEIGHIFIKARKKRKLSIGEVCKKSRIHPNVITDIEKGVFDRLGKPYVKAFLKKYSTFLDLDTESIIGQYESIASTMRPREFNLNPEQNEASSMLNAFTEKKFEKILIISLSVILVILIFVLIGMIRSKIIPKHEQESATSSKIKTLDVSSPRVSSEKLSQTAPVILTLKAHGAVWVQVNEGRNILFAGTLQGGDVKTLRSNGVLTVHAGRADMLDFVVNTRKIGVIASGVVKDIEISSRGVKIGDVWVSRF